VRTKITQAAVERVPLAPERAATYTDTASPPTYRPTGPSKRRPRPHTKARPPPSSTIAPATRSERITI
jgi:hypothetical protein